MSKKSRFNLFLILCVLVLPGCSYIPTNQPKGDGQVEIVVEPKKIGEVVSVNLVVQKIQVVWREKLSSEEKVITIRERQTFLNLAGLQEMKMKMVGIYDIPDGFISQIRYITDGGFAAFTDGSIEKIFVPSGPQTGEKLVVIDGPIEITSAQRTRVKIEFDPDETLVCTKGTGCHLKPTLKGQVVEYVPMPKEEQFRPHQVVVYFKEGVTREQIDDLNAQIGAEVIEEPSPVVPELNDYLMKIPDDMNEEEAVQFYDNSPLVESAILDFTGIKISATPTDSLFGNQTYLKTIKAEDAWNTTTGSSNVKIAILDTGIDKSHPDLINNIIPEGYDFVNNDYDSSDDNGHGTMVAGIIGATANDGGIVGINWKVSIIPIKVCDSKGICDPKDIIKGLSYAKNLSAHLANLSFSGKYVDQTKSQIDKLKSNFQKATSSTTLYIISAGNTGENQPALNIDEIPETSFVYPAQVPISNKIVVTGVDNSTPPNPWERNFYGENSVDITAPAYGFSTHPEGLYAFSEGTSISTATVSGVAGLVLVRFPGMRYNPVDLKFQITASTDYFSNLCNIVSTCGRVNAYYAVKSIILKQHAFSHN